MMTSLSPLVSSPMTTGCQETLWHFESSSSPTPAVFFRECRSKSLYPINHPGDDNDLILPHHHSTGPYTTFQNRLRSQMSDIDHQFRVNARDQDNDSVHIKEFLGLASPRTPSPKLGSSLLNTTQAQIPFHLIASSSTLAMPSPSTESMDLYPESAFPITDSPLQCNQLRAHLTHDLLKDSFMNACQKSRNPSPVIDEPRKTHLKLSSEAYRRSTSSSASPHPFFGGSDCPTSGTLTGDMEIDSPSYHTHSVPYHSEAGVPCRFSSPDLDYPDAEELVQATRSASQGSMTKRSRMEEDEDNQRPSSSTGFSKRSLGGEPAYPDTLISSDLHRPSGHFKSSTIAIDNSNPFSPEPMSSSLTDEASPCVNVFSRKTIYQASTTHAMSCFQFPESKPALRCQNEQSIIHSSTCSSNDLRDGSGVRRPKLKVAQSSATLFNRHRISASANFDIKSSQDASELLFSNSPMRHSQTKTSSIEASPCVQAKDVAKAEYHEEHEDVDMSITLNCSPLPHSFVNSENNNLSNISFKNGSKLMKSVSTGGNESRTRSAVPLSLNHLQPPSLNSMNALRSPTGSFIFTLGSTITSPVGMAFSEKERAGKILPCHKVSSDGLMRISPQTMDKLLEGVYDEKISRKMIVDCRFGYEYDGGHIRDAINFQDKEILEKMFLRGGLFPGGKNEVPIPSESGKPDANGETKKVVLVFHCEYSAMRAPTIAKHLREQDRHMNMTHYPALHYPEIYILEGGFARYFAHSPQYCKGDYVPMDHPTHRSDRNTDLNQFRTRENAGFSRARSFTYGETKPAKQTIKNRKSTVGPSRLGIGMKLNLLSGEGKENTPTRNRIIEEEDEFENDDSFQASSPLYAMISSSIDHKKSNLKMQGRSISMLAKFEQEQTKGITHNPNIFKQNQSYLLTK